MGCVVNACSLVLTRSGIDLDEIGKVAAVSNRPFTKPYTQGLQNLSRILIDMLLLLTTSGCGVQHDEEVGKWWQEQLEQLSSSSLSDHAHGQEL